MFSTARVIAECLSWLQVSIFTGMIGAGVYYAASTSPGLERVQHFCKTLVYICTIIALISGAIILLIVN